MDTRLSPFLQRRRNATSTPPKPTQPSRFQIARDWTTFVVSLTSLVTALLALSNTLVGPRPILADMAGEWITLLRSDQFQSGASGNEGLAVRDETGARRLYPLLLVQPSLANRAAPPNGVAVRSIEGSFSILRHGRSLYDAELSWFRITSSHSEPEPGTNLDRLVFSSSTQVSAFDLPGGTIWSKEIILIPTSTTALASWEVVRGTLATNCQDAQGCHGRIQLRARLDSGALLATTCRFAVDGHVLRHIESVDRKFFTTPQCIKP